MFRVLFAAAGLVATVAAVAVTSAGAGDGRLPAELQEVRAAVARYHSFEQAAKDGYTIRAGEPCVVFPGRPGSGAPAMGIHANNLALMADDAIDPLRPEILLYVPKEDGSLKLVGVEYWKRDADQNLATAGDRPTLFGQAFDGPMPGHGAPGAMPIHYDLHVWVAEKNPSGVFAMFNPEVSCP
jgi:hypothetical protein